MSNLEKLFTAYLAIAGFIWAVLNRLETVLKKEVLVAIAEHLRRPARSRQLGEWARTFLQIADRALSFVGGELRWPSFKRVWLFSVSLVVTTSMLLWLLSPGSIWGEATILVSCIIAAPPFDYLSIAKTHAIVQRLGRIRTDWESALWLAIDLVSTLIISAGAVLIGTLIIAGESALMDWVAYTVLHRHRQPEFLYDELGTHPLSAPFSILAASLISALALSMWLWLYGITTSVIRFLRDIALLRAAIDRCFDLNGKPLSVIAVVAIALFTLVFWSSVFLIL